MKKAFVLGIAVMFGLVLYMGSAPAVQAETQFVGVQFAIVRRPRRTQSLGEPVAGSSPDRPGCSNARRNDIISFLKEFRNEDIECKDLCVGGNGRRSNYRHQRKSGARGR